MRRIDSWKLKIKLIRLVCKNARPQSAMVGNVEGQGFEFDLGRCNCGHNRVLSIFLHESLWGATGDLSGWHFCFAKESHVCELAMLILKTLVLV